MNCEKLFNTIDELNEKYLNIWEDVCNIESPTDYKEGVDECGRYFIKIAEEKGWKVEVCKQDVAGDVVVITMNPDSSEQPVALSGHIDTVHPVGLFGTPPTRRDDTFIYGPGASDCKGGVVAGFLAMDALNRIGFDKRPVQLLLQSDEEKGSSPSGKATINYICEKAKDAIAFLNLEPHIAHTSTMIRKGILRYEFNITGKAVHSSLCYDGASAITEAAHKILKLEEMKDKDGITCNCGLIRGGSAGNSVPAECSIVADLRYPEPKDYDIIDRRMKEIAEENTIEGCTCEVKQISSRPAMHKAEKNFALLNKANKIFKENGLPELTVRINNGGSDAAYVTLNNIPCMDSLGVEGLEEHSEFERAKLDSLKNSAKRIAALTYCIE